MSHGLQSHCSGACTDANANHIWQKGRCGPEKTASRRDTVLAVSLCCCTMLCHGLGGWKRTSKRFYRGRRQETRKKVTMKVKMREYFNNSCQERKEMFYSVWLTMCVALKKSAAVLESEMRVPTGENPTLLFWGWAKAGRIFRWSGQSLKMHGGRTWLKTWTTLCSASPDGCYHCIRHSSALLVFRNPSITLDIYGVGGAGSIRMSKREERSLVSTIHWGDLRRS